MTYNVFGGTLNPTLLLDQYQIILLGKTDTERVCVCACGQLVKNCYMKVELPGIQPVTSQLRV